MWEFFGTLFLWAVPPHDADGKRVYRWRVTMAAALMANALVTGTFIALAFGAVPAVFAGFANASDTQAIQTAVNQTLKAQQSTIGRVQKNQLDSKIMDTRIRQCAAIKASTQHQQDADTAVQFATERLQEQLDEYWTVTGRRYRLPDCSEV